MVPLGTGEATRTTGDRLEILTALMAAPTFETIFRTDVITVPGDHPVHGWVCRLPGCECPQDRGYDYCQVHYRQWREMRAEGKAITEFLRVAEPLKPRALPSPPPCLICPEVPASARNGLCYLHTRRWIAARGHHRKANGVTLDFDAWVADQQPFVGFGPCRIGPCPELADNPLGLCRRHTTRYQRDNRPGQAQAAYKQSRWQQPATARAVIPVIYGDRTAFDRWCRETSPIHRTDGKVSLVGLRPLVKAEIQWTLFHHGHTNTEGRFWWLGLVQHLADHCRLKEVNSLVDLDLSGFTRPLQQLVTTMLHYLRLVYFSRQDTKDAGFIEIEHFGVLLPESSSYFDLAGVSQRWLRDLLWDDIAARLTADPPRSRAVFDQRRRGCLELSAYLEAQAPQGGHDPTLLNETHMTGFVADQRHRAEHNLPSLAVHVRKRSAQSRPTAATKGTLATNFNGVRRVLRGAMDTGADERIGLDRSFIVAAPYGKGTRGRRNPFPDDVARALANKDNLRDLQALDADDRGLRDIWEALVLTGRRCSEVLEARLECIGRLKGVAMFWHDQTKIGNFDEGIRIPDWLYGRIEERQAKTVARFFQRHGRPPSPTERREVALFPRRATNRYMLKSVSYGWFSESFREWVKTLDIRHCVPHQARHSLATNLLKAGANLTHVKRYLGQVSEAMAEHYVHIANTDPRLNDALQAVWVGGPGSSEPGILLSTGEPLTRQQAEALAIDLSRRSTPADGGFCTFQPVVNGDACPWNLNCHSCDKFVMSGADLVYWHRKRQQWRMLAEQSPDSATADYLHEVFEPTARAIAGLERALEAVGLLDEALALDLRRPQDYFGRVWSTAFRAQDLVDQQNEADAA
ncbi:hypothetical protein TPA0598_01_10390 [Streptomyces lydicamycinicus]|uniref:Tyr recombinase domain-containing protein n=1 Tax=Streptomyces lydicamycinicus TaxID=1546107 RepID=A0A0P4R2F3_9ACTN|nr:hypothetical protein TPA0598_01_10390 [Streptomyces lydicamycinicus]